MFVWFCIENYYILLLFFQSCFFWFVLADKSSEKKITPVDVVSTLGVDIRSDDDLWKEEQVSDWVQSQAGGCSISESETRSEQTNDTGFDDVDNDITSDSWSNWM